MLSEAAALGGLFLAAFGAATILPFQSELVFVGLQLRDISPIWLLVLVASVGNTLGAAVNYVLGLWVERFRHHRWFPASEAQLDRAQRAYARWGVWTLLLSWAPFIGDPLTIVAGVMREPLWRFTLIVLVAKGGRYLILAGVTLGWLAD